MDNLSLDAKIEAFLFYKGEPVSFTVLAKVFGAENEEIVEALKVLEEKLSGRGLSLVTNESEVMLGTNVSLSSFFEEMRK